MMNPLTMETVFARLKVNGKRLNKRRSGPWIDIHQGCERIGEDQNAWGEKRA